MSYRKSLSVNFRFKGSQGYLRIWEVKKKEEIRRLKGHRSSVMSVRFHSDGVHVASCSSSGEVLIHSLNNDHFSLLPTSSNTSTVAEIGMKELEFSRMKKTVLGGCSDDGSVYVWDVNTNAITANFQRQHQAPASAVSFSTVNHLLLSSAGMDKRILFYDIIDHK